MDIKILCKYDELVDPKSLHQHPKNRNKHPKDQVDRLAKLIEYQGIRAPIIVIKKSNTIVKGNGSLLAYLQMELKEIPVVYQTFKNKDQEYAFVQSDNAIAAWAELDFGNVNDDLKELDGSNFDIDMLGIKDFTIDPADNTDEGFSPSENSNAEKAHKVCPHCGEAL